MAGSPFRPITFYPTIRFKDSGTGVVRKVVCSPAPRRTASGSLSLALARLEGDIEYEPRLLFCGLAYRCGEGAGDGEADLLLDDPLVRVMLSHFL
jgi:hypothetical protein